MGSGHLSLISSRNCVATDLSESLEMYWRLLTGRKLLKISSSFADFNSGVTSAHFHSSVNCPLDSERLSIAVMMGKSACTHCFNSFVGIGSWV